LRMLAATVVGVALAATAGAQEAQTPVAPASDEPTPFHVGGYVKFAFRDSRPVETELFFPFPPSFIPAGETDVKQRTVSPGSSLEVPNVALVAEGDIASHVGVKADVHFLDLYNRNPTSSDHPVFRLEPGSR